MAPLAEELRPHSAASGETSTHGSLLPPQQGQISRSSLSTIECGETKPSPKSMTKRWTTLETAGRCMFTLSVAFFIGGLLMTIVGFTNLEVLEQARLPLQIIGPVCLVTTAVMWLLGAVFSRLWKMEWKSRQQALELRARVQLHAMAMDILNEPVLSPRIMQDPKLRRQLLTRLRQQSAMDSGSLDPPLSRRSSRVPALDAKRQSVVAALLRQDLARRQSKDPAALLPSFELPGIQISRIETVDYEDGPGSSTGVSGGGGPKRYIIFHSDLSSEFSQLSFTSEDFLPGSRSSRSRSSRASSNISSRLWDFSPRESEWDADVSQGSRDSQLSRQDWGGGPSYGMDRQPSPLSPTMPRKGSVVTFDTGDPAARRHSSPIIARRRGSSAGTGAGEGHHPPPPPSALRNGGGLRYVEDYRTLTQFRKRSAGDQSIISVAIDENDGDEEEEEDALTPLNGASLAVGPSGREAQLRTSATEEVTEIMVLALRRGSLKRNDTDDSEVERGVLRILREIDYSTTDSVDETKILSTLSSAEAAVPTAQAQTQTLTDPELEALWELGGTASWSPLPVGPPRRFGMQGGQRSAGGMKAQGGVGHRQCVGEGAVEGRQVVSSGVQSRSEVAVVQSASSEETRAFVPQAVGSVESQLGGGYIKSRRFKWMSYLPSVLTSVVARKEPDSSPRASPNGGQCDV